MSDCGMCVIIIGDFNAGENDPETLECIPWHFHDCWEKVEICFSFVINYFDVKKQLVAERECVCIRKTGHSRNGLWRYIYIYI